MYTKMQAKKRKMALVAPGLEAINWITYSNEQIQSCEVVKTRTKTFGAQKSDIYI